MFSCIECGKKFQKLSELQEIRSLGLALKGTCPGCNTRMAINQFWKRTEILSQTSEISGTDKFAEQGIVSNFLPCANQKNGIFSDLFSKPISEHLLE